MFILKGYGLTVDRDLTDDQARWHSSIIATIVRQASELTYLTLNDRK